MVAVQVGQEDAGQAADADGHRGHAHEHAAPAVEEQVEAAGPHERGGTGPVRIGQGRSGAERDRLHGVSSRPAGG